MRSFDKFQTCEFHKTYIGILSIQVNIVMEWKSEDHLDSKSILLQVMAWCHQAGGHYLNQCWPSSMTQYGVRWPQSRCVDRFWWVRTSVPMGIDHHLDPHYSDAIVSAMAFQISDVLIAQPFVQAQIRENIKIPRIIGLCEGNPPVIGGFLTKDR